MKGDEGRVRGVALDGRSEPVVFSSALRVASGYVSGVGGSGIKCSAEAYLQGQHARAPILMTNTPNWI